MTDDVLSTTTSPSTFACWHARSCRTRPFPAAAMKAFGSSSRREVHAALWQHAALDTSVEICGVLVGTWHRDEAGPFVKIVESIRGEGAETRFAEVTFTHQTWAKINAEMDTKFSKLSIVGWYHTHPDFGIFLSDRDRFIHEHFFSGPGQIAHVIDPIRKTEGVFIWRGGKPSPASISGSETASWPTLRGGSEQSSELETGPRSRMRQRCLGGQPARRRRGQQPTPGGNVRESFPGPGALIVYAIVFFLGYLLANILSAWEHQRFVESVLASNGFVAVLRLGLPMSSTGFAAIWPRWCGRSRHSGSKTDKPEEQLAELRAQVVTALRRTEAIKAQYGNTAAEDDMLKRMLRDRLMSPGDGARSPEIPNPETSQPKDPRQKTTGESGPAVRKETGDSPRS